MSVFVTWIDGRTTLETMSAERLELLKVSNRVKRLETCQNGQTITLKGDMTNE